MTMTPTGQQVLAGYRDAMVHHMIAESGAKPAEAELSIGQLWDRWVLRCARDTGRDTGYGATAVTAALAFLADDTHSPGTVADDGWHTMLGYTREYAALCHAIRGQFINHCPNDVAGLPQRGACTGDCHCNGKAKCGGNPPCATCTD
jgi:hypothetical protein